MAILLNDTFGKPGYSEADVDRIDQRMQKEYLQNLKRKDLKAYHRQLEYNAFERRGMSLTNWSSYTTMFKVRQAASFGHFSAKSEGISDTDTPETFVRMWTRARLNQNGETLHAHADRSGKSVLQRWGISAEEHSAGSWGIDSNATDVVVLFVAIRQFEGNEYAHIAYRRQYPQEPAENCVVFEGVTAKKTSTGFQFTGDLEWSLIERWSSFARVRGRLWGAYEDVQKTVYDSSFPREYIDLEGEVGDAKVKPPK